LPFCPKHSLLCWVSRLLFFRLLFFRLLFFRLLFFRLLFFRLLFFRLLFFRQLFFLPPFSRLLGSYRKNVVAWNPHKLKGTCGDFAWILWHSAGVGRHSPDFMAPT
jgi:hypothetical protein